ncbi:MAG TPA: trehalose-phosphatase, partial [Burkholderiales bacterium]
MRHLFSPEGSAALAATMEQRPLLAFDFDGTLASIMPRPAEARVSQEVAQRLDRLSQVLPLAIITGRSIDDVRGRLTFEPRFIIGSHGAEDPAATCGVKPSVFDAVRARLRELAAELDVAGVTVEDKHYSMALHYRLSPDRVRALELITDLVSGLGSDVNVYGGKMVMNVVAAQAPDKAQAVASLVAKCGTRSAVFVGDDVNDEPVFA